jgi:hypothetical protein
MLAAILVVLAAAAPEAAPPAASQPAVPAAAAPAPTPAAAPAPAGKKEMICKSEQATGSRFPTKVCYSKEEYEAKRQLDQQQLRQNQTGGFQRQ